MALNFAKKTPGSASTGSNEPEKKPAGIFFIKKGLAAKQAVAKEDAQAELRKSKGAWEFSLKYNEDASITFLDGLLDEDGVLEVPRFYQHTIQGGPSWQSYVCTAETDTSQPCPLCEADYRPSLVGVMTVIDHRNYTVQKGPNAGKVLPHQIRPFVAKDGTIKQLGKLAQKPERAGLALCTFDVSRGPETKHPARVGDTFDFTTKHKSLEAIAAFYGLKVEDVKPLQYDGEGGVIHYIPPAKLIELGLGKAHSGVGYEKGISSVKDEL